MPPALPTRSSLAAVEQAIGRVRRGLATQAQAPVADLQRFRHLRMIEERLVAMAWTTWSGASAG